MHKNLILLLVLFFTATISQAADPTIWATNSRNEFLKGEAKGVSVTDTGAIVVSPKLTESYNTQQSYIWSSAADNSGNVYLGTGNDGKIFKVGANGSGALFTDLNELDVSALAIGKDGALYAGTSPDGKVYRIDSSGKAETYFDPADKYIWSLAAASDGSLVIGTGENGKIYRVRSANANPDSSLAFDSSDTHIITMKADKNGNVYAGTDSNGLVLRIGADNKVFALLDAPLREIHEIAVGPDGSVYALALSDSASASRPVPAGPAGAVEVPTPPIPVPGGDPLGGDQPPPKSRYDLTASKSAVFRIRPDGGNEVIWNSPNVTGFSVFANQGGVLIGTSDKGRIYSVTNDGRETLLLQTNEGQVSTILSDGKKLFATSSNQGKLYSFGTETGATGSFESNVRDARGTALWGRIWWRGNGSIQIQTRTGNTQKPDETWSDWSANLADPKGAQVSSPRARFMQWRATLNGGATLNEVNVSYLAQNIAPEVLQIQLMPTSVGLASNPPMQIDPNIETSGLDPAIFGMAAPPAIPRRVYQRGARGLQWTAEDRNGDKLEYDIYYREESATAFRLLRAGLKDPFFTLDGLSMADGRYVFKVVAKDTPSNPLPQSFSGEKISDVIEIDNTAPVVTAVGTPSVSGERARVTFEAADTTSFIKRAEYSIDGSEWLPVYAEDGISDSQRERYVFDVMLKSAGEYSVTLRVFDDAGNIGTAKVLVRR